MSKLPRHTARPTAEQIRAAALGKSARDAIARAALGAVRMAEARLGKPVVCLMVDPTDPRVAALMPSLAAGYASATVEGGREAMRVSSIMVMAADGSTVAAVTGSTFDAKNERDAEVFDLDAYRRTRSA